MKRFPFWFLFTVILFGCQPSVVKNYQTGVPLQATVGSSMMTWGMLRGVWGSRSGVVKALIYGGVSQNVVQISYREFASSEEGLGSNYARPAFSQELKYDLTSSKVITYQDVRIEVQSADGEKIAYTITRGPQETEGVTANGSPGSGRIGVRVAEGGVIDSVIAGTPASLMDLHVGDRIVEINHEQVGSLAYIDLMSKLQGDVGTKVLLGIKREGRSMQIELVRQ